METLILSADEVKRLITMKEAISAVEEAFKDHALSKAIMPPKIYLNFDQGDLRAMPAFIMGYAGVKWVNSHPKNPEKGLPSVMAILTLNDPSTGFPLAVMDATFLTSLRTGAAGGVAIKYLARKDSRIFGFVGCGRQARFQLLAIKELCKIELLKAFDVSKKAEEDFKKFCESQGVKCELRALKEVCNCDVLVTTTPATKPVVKDEWIKEGTHINAIGADAPGKQELEIETMLRAKIVVDDLHQALHGGEVNVAVSKGLISEKEIYASLGEIVAGKKKGREGNEITIFDSTGLAIQDLAVAKIVYDKAIKSNVGNKLRLLDLE
ncbi:MAG: alanine dehydrogenase [Archaeoglobaceae archaeon]|nr:alanine dehydrogenase [Archaeoglobaceae archaeon]MDW8118117.1 alanine dehydrogenase [Archaeoglobaceae archaeon]